MVIAMIVMMMTTKMTTPQMPKGQLDFCPTLSNFLGVANPCKWVASLLLRRSAPKPEDCGYFHLLDHVCDHIDDHVSWFVDLFQNLGEKNKNLAKKNKNLDNP